MFCLQGDGIFCPGGSAANMYGFSLARFKRFPESKTKGMQGIPPVHIYTSELVSNWSISLEANVGYTSLLDDKIMGFLYNCFELFSTPD